MSRRKRAGALYDVAERGEQVEEGRLSAYPLHSRWERALDGRLVRDAVRIARHLRCWMSLVLMA